MARRNILLSAILIVGGRAIGGEECLMYGLILAVIGPILRTAFRSRFSG